MSSILYQAPYDSFDDIVLLQDILPFFDGYDKKPLMPYSEHSLVNAFWMSEFCRLVYITSVGKIEEECAKINMDVKCFWKNHTEFLVAHDEDKMVIAARGTETATIHDALTDLNCFRTPSATLGNVHGGFKKAVDFIWDDMNDYVQANSEGKTIFYTGHSLGAGLSTIAASRLDGAALYTFGSPRVGNSKFALYMNMRLPHYRYVNSGDPIPALPFPIFNWRHFGEMQLISSDVFVVNASRTQGMGQFLKKKLLSKLLMVATLGKWVLLDLVAEHNILSYNNFLRWQVNLPPHKIPAEYLERVGK